MSEDHWLVASKPRFAVPPRLRCGSGPAMTPPGRDGLSRGLEVGTFADVQPVSREFQTI